MKNLQAVRIANRITKSRQILNRCLLRRIITTKNKPTETLSEDTGEADEMNSGMKISPKYLYVVFDGELCKIGITYRLNNRISEIQNASGRKAKLILAFKCQDTESHEKNLHKHFRSYRRHGEWFKLDFFHLDQIETYFENHGVEPTVKDIRDFWKKS